MNFLKQSASTFATQIILMITGMAAGIIVARILGPELKGQTVLLTLVAQTLFMICSMGMGSAFSFFIAKKRYSSHQIMSAALAYTMVFGSVGLALFYGTWPLHRSLWGGIPPFLLVMAGVLAFGYIYSSYVARMLVGYGRIYEINAGELMRSLINFLAIVVLVWCVPLGVTGFMTAQFFAVLSQMLLIVWFLRADLHLTCFWKDGLVRESFRYGLKSHALLLINFLNYRIDILILKFFTDDAVVGYYSLAVGMAELMWLVPNATVAPLFSNIAQSEAADRSLVTLRTVRWSLLFLLTLTIAGICFGRLFIGLLYGKAYLPSYEPFLLLLPGICLFPLFKLLIVDLSARGYPGYGTVTSAIALVVNVVGNFLLIPWFGGEGAAMATSISYTVMSVISLVLFSRVTGTRFSEIFLFRKSEIQTIKINLIRFLGKSG